MALDALTGFGRLVLSIDGILTHRASVTRHRRVIEPPVGGDENLDPAVLAEVDQASPLPQPARATAALPDGEYVGVERAGLEVGDKLCEALALLAGVAAGAATGVAVRLGVSHPPVLRERRGVLGFLLVETLCCAVSVLRDA